MTLLDWNQPHLEAQLRTVDAGFTVEVATSLASTNSELMQRARCGTGRPTLLIAETQTAGRGRLGRHWQSAPLHEPGNSLTFSLGMAMPAGDWAGLSLAVGCCVAKCLESESMVGAGRRIGLKWPNDLWWQGRKLAGVLIETVVAGAGLYVVVGVGVNIALPGDTRFGHAAAGLDEIDPGLSASQALSRLALPLALALRRFSHDGFAAFRADFEVRDVLKGREILGLSAQDESAAPMWVGQGCGVDVSGALLVHTGQGMQRITSSEVRIRPSVAPGLAPTGKS